MKDSCIAFKEWQVVCDALASGRQSILLRKGGIHEGRQGFSFAHDSYFLFPTRFHAQGGHVREGAVHEMPEWQPGDLVRITHHAEAVCAVTLDDWEKVAALEPLHIFTEATVRDRFDWEGKGMSAGNIHVALVRVRETPDQHSLPRAQRLHNLRDAFAAHPRHAARLTGAQVLLVDDVSTTGATLEAAAQALLNGGAVSVDALVLAHTPPGD